MDRVTGPLRTSIPQVEFLNKALVTDRLRLVTQRKHAEDFVTKPRRQFLFVARNGLDCAPRSAQSSLRILALICSNSASLSNPFVFISLARCNLAIGEFSSSSLVPTPSDDTPPAPLIPRAAPI